MIFATFPTDRGNVSVLPNQVYVEGNDERPILVVMCYSGSWTYKLKERRGVVLERLNNALNHQPPGED